MARRVASALIVLLLAGALAAPAALADGDPASDVLLGENVFYPYSPPVTRALQQRLNGATAAAKKAGLPLKVALIGAPTDLGVVPELFGKPQTYADFLDKEISFTGKAPPLLVVMPAGYGVQGLSPAATRAARTLTAPSGKTNDALAAAAVTAVQRLAAASGHPIPGTADAAAAAPQTGGGSDSVLILVVVVGVAVLAAGGLIFARRRHATASRRA